MPKCSGPTATTRGVSWPLGLCRTKVAWVAPRREDLDRLMRLSFRVRRVLPFPYRKAASARGLFSFLFLPTYIPSRGHSQGCSQALLSCRGRPCPVGPLSLSVSAATVSG